MAGNWEAINEEWKRLVTKCDWHVDVGPRRQARVREPGSGWIKGTPGDESKKAVPSQPDNPGKELLVFMSPVRMELCKEEPCAGNGMQTCCVYRETSPRLACVVDATRLDVL